MLSKPIILVATDFSENSDLALCAAESLRRRVSGSIHLIHVDRFTGEWDRVSGDVWMDFVAPQYTEKMLRVWNNMLEEQAKRCEATCTHEIYYGNPYHVLKDLEVRLDADLIVIGHRGTGSKHKHLGGLVSKFIASSDVPVLVINKVLDIKKVAGLVAPSSPAAHLFSWSEELAHLYSADLQFISVWRNMFSHKHQKESFISSVRLDFSDEEKIAIQKNIEKDIQSRLPKNSKARVKVLITEEKSVTECIGDLLKDESIDLALMTRHNKGVLEKLLIGSTTRRILDVFAGNILILPSKDDTGSGGV